MTLVKCIIALVLVALGVCTIAKASTRHRHLYIVGGFFFHRLPVAQSAIIHRTTLTAPQGTKAEAIVTALLPSELPLHDALPAAVIPESDSLLRLYNQLTE